MKTNVFVADGVVVERVGEDLVALVPHSEVVTLTGQAADVVGRVMAGEDVDPSDEAVIALVDAGVLTAPAGLTRRKVMQLGAVATGVGVATMALPSVAAAASIPLGSGGTWYWENRHAVDQERRPEDRAGYPDPAWTRVFIVNLSSDFVLPTGDPSSLSVLGKQVTHRNLVDAETGQPTPAGAQGVLVFNNDVSTETPTQKTEPLTGDLTGSYTWGGATYEVTFDQAPDLP